MMIKLRKANKELIYGDFEEIYCKDDLLAFKRVLKDTNILVLFNNSDKDETIELNLNCKGTNLITGEIEKINKVKLDKKSFAVFKY